MTDNNIGTSLPGYEIYYSRKKFYDRGLLPTNIRLAWKTLRTNTLAYFDVGDEDKRFFHIDIRFSDKTSNDELSSINESLFVNEKDKKRHLDNDSPISLQV